MSSDNLGRLVAAERNALAALENQKTARQVLQDLVARVARLEQENHQLKQQITTITGQIYAARGSGPTA